jgi:putative glutamine amidotransferase
MKIKILLSSYCLFIVSFFVDAQPIVLISKSYGNGTYERWLLAQNPDLKLVSMYHVSKDSVDYWLKNASGFLMTGGEDIYPGRYGKEKDTSNCGDFDLRRDSLEFKMLDYAFSYKRPVFGVCRGFQLINVHQKGSLIVDIPTTLGVKVRHREDGPTTHEVEVLPKTMLSKISKVKIGTIASNHHQGVDVLGKFLLPSAKSADGLIEAFEGNSESKMPFLMAVQWHPEKMESNDPLSKSLADAFVKALGK